MTNLVKVLLLSVLPVLVMGSTAWAQDASVDVSIQALEAVNLDQDYTAEDLGVSEPRILPDSPFYFFKNWGRSIQSIFTFDSVKKAELKLKFASEKLIEAQKMAAKKVSSEKIINALNDYQKETERVKKEVEKKNLKIDGPKVEKFFEKLIDRNFIQQKLLDKIEKELPADSYQEIKEIKERALENFTNSSLKIAPVQTFRKEIERVAQTQKGSQLKHLKNLEVLMRIEEKVPEVAKEAIRTAQANTLKRLKGNIETISEEEKPILKEYLKRIGGNGIKHLEIVSELENLELSTQDRQAVEETKAEAVKKVETKLKILKTDVQKQIYLKHLQTGDMGKLRVIKELEESFAPEEAKELIEIKIKAQDNFRRKLEKLETPEAKEIFFKRIEAVPSVRTFEVLEEITEIISPKEKTILREMKERAVRKMEREIETAETAEARTRKLEALSSGSVAAPQVIKELRLPAGISAELKVIGEKKLEKRIERTEDSQKLEILRQRIKVGPAVDRVEAVEMLEKKTEKLIKEIKPELVLEQIEKAEQEIKKAKRTVETREADKYLKEAQRNYKSENYREAYKDAVSVIRVCAEACQSAQKTKLIEGIKIEWKEKQEVDSVEKTIVPSNNGGTDAGVIETKKNLEQNSNR